MAAVTGTVAREFVIEENRLFFKGISCIPFVGAIPSFFWGNSLTGRIEMCNEPDRLIALIKVKNDYRITSIIRSIFEVALLIAAIYTKILTGGPLLAIFCITYIGLSCMKAGANCSRFGHHNEMIRDYESVFRDPGYLAFPQAQIRSQTIRDRFGMGSISSESCFDWLIR